MTNTKKDYLQSAEQAGLSPKEALVYTILLEAGMPLSSKALIARARIHRQYVYDALESLLLRRLVVRSGEDKKVRYHATSPDRLLQEAEKKRLDALAGVTELMRVYDRSPAGVVEVLRGSKACIESEFVEMVAAKRGDFLDIVGGAGMQFVDLFGGRVSDWEEMRKEKGIQVRYIGSGDDVVHNKTASIIQNESRMIPGIGQIVNVCIRPESVSFNIYEPEVLTVRVRSREAVASQRALFEILWGVAK